MKSKLFILRFFSTYTLLIVLFFSCLPFSMTKLSFGDETTSLSDIYIVTEGDTLWDISNRFFANPFLWPHLWEKNPQIKDPHWIYPGQIIYLRGIPIPNIALDDIPKHTPYKEEKVVERVEESRKHPIEAIPPSEPKYAASEETVNTCSFLIPRQVLPQKQRAESWGKIIKTKENKINLSFLDLIYIDYGDKSISPGQELIIFKVEENFKALPYINQHYNLIKIVGKAQVKEVYPDLSLAQIIKTNSEVNVGDFVRPYNKIPPVEIKSPGIEYLEGKIIASIEMKEYLANYDIIFINQGSESGLEPGNPLEIFRFIEIPLGQDNKEIRKVIQPLGMVYVLKTEKETSTCIIAKSLEPIMLGDYLRISKD